MDIPKLAQDAAQILAPFLPYLIAGGKEAAKAAFARTGENFADAVWKKGETLWEKLKGKVDTEQDAVKRALQKPEEKRVIQNLESSLALQLEDAFNEDAGLRDSVNLIIGGDVKDSQVAVGDRNIQIKDSPNARVYVNSQKDTNPEPESLEQLTHDYLQSLIADCEKLPLGAIHVTLESAEHDAAISLEDVYIDLDVAPRLKGEDAKMLRGDMQEGREAQRLPVVQALTDDSLRRVVLLGEAGSGKTTCVHYLTIALASLQQNVILKRPLPEDSALSKYFPVRLILRDVAVHIPADPKSGGVDILWNALREDLNRKLGKDQAEALYPDLAKRIKNTPCLIMLDGLDEVSEAEQRRPRLLEAIRIFAENHKQSIIMVTARPYAYDNPKWHLPHFETLNLLELSEEQIENFISRFYDSIRGLKNWEEDFADARKRELSDAVLSRAYLKELAKRPLLLTLIASVDSSGSKLPEDRAELYKQTIDLMLQRWQQRKETSLAEKEIVKFFSTDTGRVIDILQKLAFKVHDRQGRGKDPREDAPADIDSDEIWGAFSSALPKEVDIEALLNFLEKRAGLLLDRGESVYAFPPRSFQEYLAAGYLNAQSEEKYHLDVIFRSGPKWWREVVLLGIARLTGSLKNAANEVNMLVPCRLDELERQATETDWQAAALAGQALVEMRLIEKGADQKIYTDIIKRIANWLVALIQGSHLTPRERTEAADTLARLGDPRPGVTTDFVFCKIPAGTFKMGSKEDEKDSNKSEYPQFEYNIPNNYFMSRYPVTNAQFEQFVKAEGYKQEEYWREAKDAGWWSKDGFKGRFDNEARNEPLRIGGAYALPNHPVVGVSWYEAAAFCNWLTGQFQVSSARCQVYDSKTRSIVEDDNLKSSIENRKSIIRLPTEAEWERAARGGHEFRYPWGSDEITPDHANYGDTNLNTTSAVGAFPKGRNDYGLLDMSGNVWEWCATASQGDYKEYVTKENNKPEGDVACVLRGGAYDSGGWSLRCAFRGWDSPVYRLSLIGFRCVVCASFPISP